jgi:hypothetical protein
MDALPDIMTGGFAFDIITEGQDHLSDRLSPQTLLEGSEVEVVWTDAVNRREPSMEDVISPAVRQGTFERHQIGNLLNNTEGGGIALRVTTDFTELAFRQTTAAVTAPDALGGGLEGGQERRELSGLFNQKVQRNAFRRTMPEAR